MQTFDPHTTLNPKIWNLMDRSLDPKIRSALLNIAKDFKKFIDIEFSVADVVITGSQAGYNWTDLSDLDLHLVVDYSRISCDRELEELFNTKRHLYNNRYQIRVRDIPVELYVEDLAQPAQGPAYSLRLEKWLRYPTAIPQTISAATPAEVNDSVNTWSNIIQGAIKSKNAEILEKTQKLLKKYRVLGLKNAGEFGAANLTYKTLRNQELLAKLAKATDQAVTKKLSVPEQRYYNKNIKQH